MKQRFLRRLTNYKVLKYIAVEVGDTIERGEKKDIFETKMIMTCKRLSKALFGVRLFQALVSACILASFSQRRALDGGGCQAFGVQTITVGPISRKESPYTTRLQMNFISDFFGSFQEKMNTGGSYNLGIDYDALEFPGPEVGAMAVSITRSRKEASSNDEALSGVPSVSPSLPLLELATLAGGCFWGLELALQRCEGIEHTLVGYTQGGDSEVRPNYEQVSAGNTGHCEAVMVYFDPSKISYDEILKTAFLSRVDVTTVDGQGRDCGRQYRTGIYFHTSEQEKTARRLLEEEVATNPRYAGIAGVVAPTYVGKAALVATEVEPAKAFWPAEGYHQRYLEKGGRFGQPQSAEKGNTDEIRCYG